VDSLVQELLGGSEKSTGHHDDGGSSISSLNILSLGDLDEHLGGGVDDLHLLEDGGAIIGDQNSTLAVLDLKGVLIRAGKYLPSYPFLWDRGRF